MIKVSFLKVWRMYQPGEVAGFDQGMATAIVEAGFAVMLEDPRIEGEDATGADVPLDPAVITLTDDEAAAKAAAEAEAEAAAKAEAAKAGSKAKAGDTLPKQGG